MADEFKDDVVVAAKDDGGARGWSRGTGPIEEDFEDGGSFSAREGARPTEDSRVEGGSIERVLPKSVEDRLDAMDARHREARESAHVYDDGEAAGDESTTETEIDPNGGTVTPPPTPAAAPANDERYTRLESANRDLAAKVAELEALSGKPAAVPPMHKLLAEASENYIDDVPGAFRRLVAASMGIEDLNDKRIDDEVRDAYADLTAHVIGVTPEPQHLAKREAARARAMLAREKRERTAEKQTAADQAKADAEAQKATQAASFIGNRLQTKRSDGRSIADDHPLLMRFAQKLDGITPDALIWRTLQHEAKTGRIAIDPADDDKNISAAARILEDHYKTLADEFGKTTPLPTTQSTAKPNGAKTPPAAVSEPGKEARQAHGARTLTTADRSVAPAAPPAKKPAATTTERPKFKSKDDQQNWALRHLDKRPR